MKLTELEEDVVLRNVLDKIDRGFAPRVVDVGDMANILLAERGARRVGKHWVNNFIKR